MRLVMAVLTVSSAFLIWAGILLVEGIAPLHKTAEKVPDSYIVKLKDNCDVDVVAQQLEDHVIMRRSGGRLTHRYRRSIRGFGAYLPTKEAVNLVLNHEAVEYVQENGIVRVTSLDEAQLTSSSASRETSSNIPWNLDRIDQAELPLDGRYNPANDGNDVTVYVLDTGILPTHAEFGQRASACFDALGGTGIDCTGHGTYVAGIVAGETYGVASKVRVCGVRVVGASCDTEGTVADVVAGIDWVGHHASKPAVVTLSLNMYGEHIPLGHALDGLIELTGVTVVVAAGNMDDDACNCSPSGNEQVITVGATNVEDTRWPSSNWGPCVDIFAPGVEVKSATRTGPHDTMILSGTSVACPHVAGAAAIILAEDPSLTHASVKAKILAAGTPDVLLFNQGNTTETIEATDNLLMRVQTEGAPSEVKENFEEKTELNIEKPIPKIVFQNVDRSQIEP
ncbi:extracellular serine proteinase-like [Patiria miniata]|uniref:Serine protease n=1 Tax=Patiria miniata TaxID=46514 RepID=A0A914B9L7_PATMI|nr:extracellular serine proteinase-like [Patiria miniata]